MQGDEVTALGEELAELHVETLTDSLDDEMRQHYQRALDHYESAKQALADATTADEVLAISETCVAARYHRACVVALRDGEELPQRRDPCFFDPRHGPAHQDVAWTPPGGVPRSIPVCADDARRLAAGEEPITRQVRVGDRWVPYHQSGGVAATLTGVDRAAADGRFGDQTRRHLGEAYLRSNFRGPGSGGVGGGGYI